MSMEKNILDKIRAKKYNKKCKRFPELAFH
jgi:hypothetical protein